MGARRSDACVRAVGRGPLPLPLRALHSELTAPLPYNCGTNSGRVIIQRDEVYEKRVILPEMATLEPAMFFHWLVFSPARPRARPESGIGRVRPSKKGTPTSPLDEWQEDLLRHSPNKEAAVAVRHEQMAPGG